ncbi:MAG TPA: chemotaxis protein CheW [Calditerricola sp.]|uniref:Chemotaxis protein CheW n=1 Tax=Calditerricola satsumensis TaxID=373054 RepID=A0A8J3BCX8_9BACI|nr:chemotaxis protein CheW [Calditerricola satsumensis]GGJ97783.1 chemotaxis protein CheW [Calditerricola satsumensis]
MTEQKTTANELKVIVFQLNDESYGVDVYQVRSIERMQPITRVPGAPPFVKGVINLRGVVTPVIDLRSRLGLKERPYTDETRIIIVSVDDKDVGLIVDAANDVIDLPASSVEPPPDVVGGVRTEFLRGVAKWGDGVLVLLNLDRVLTLDERTQLKQLEG